MGNNRILGILGSPRNNGNTATLLSRILDSASANGAETEYITLGDKTIRECDGCHACWRGLECVKHDDMNDVYPVIERSDIIVFGTPVYWYGPTALMKALIDRMVYFNCPETRKKIAGKRAVLVVPFEESDSKTAAPTVTIFEMSLSYLGIPLIETLIVPGVTRRGEVRGMPEFMERAEAIGERLARLL